MKTTIYSLMMVFFTIIANYAYANSCLPSNVKVLDDNGNEVYVNPALLAQYSPYKGHITYNQSTGFANFVPDELQTQPPCYDFPIVTAVTPADKTYTIAPNQNLKIKALLDNNFKPRDQFTIANISAEPTYGRARIKPNRGIIKYTPHKDWCGVDNLSYELQSEKESIIENVKINVSCTLDEATLPPSMLANDEGYTAKVFDANGDGLQDVYIERKLNGRHQDFYLKQKAGAKFDLVTSTNSQLAMMAAYAPETDIIVIRADFNADGMLDFLISNIDAYIWNADEQIILSKKKDSSKLDKIIAIDAKFRAIRDFMENVLSQQKATPVYVGLYDNTYSACRIVYLPITVYSSYYESWITYYVPYYMCMSGRNFLQRYLEYEESFNFIKSLSTINQNYGLNGFNSLTGVWYPGVLGTIMPHINNDQLIRTAKTAKNGARIWRAGSVTATVILLADDITIVGIANDVGLIATVGSIAVAYITESALDYYIQTMGSNANNSDIGVKPGDASLGAGPFAIPDNCDPKTPGQKPASGKGSSGNLKKNLIKSNCGCLVKNIISAAHHIVPRTAGGPVGDQLRACLKNRKIDMDSAINGVCLPKEHTDESNAFPHRGNEGNIHGEKRLKELLALCKSNNYSNTQFENLLRDIAKGYTKGIMLP